jgi:electron transport complex protein RnfG
MAKKESTFINMVTTLFLVTLVASTALAYVYELTREPIEMARLAKKLKAIDAVVPEYDNQPVDDMYKVAAGDGMDSLEFYPAKKDGKIVGTAIRTYTNTGYNGLIVLMVGITPDEIVKDVSVVQHKETPGLGTKMAESQFKDQFKNLDPFEVDIRVEKDGGDIDAITAATISSRAFSEATQLAIDTYKKGVKK